MSCAFGSGSNHNSTVSQRSQRSSGPTSVALNSRSRCGGKWSSEPGPSIASNSASDGNTSQTNRKPNGITISPTPARRRHPPPESVDVKIKRVMFATRHTHNKTGAKDVGNSTSSAPAMSKLRSRGPGLGKSHASAASSGSSPSASRSGEPARICSAIRPEFWRIATSIFAVMSGLALRNAFEFSRPWPSRWLS